MSAGPEQWEFTGKHMLILMICFFATIILVNLALAIAANKSWTGFVVKDSYVASQQFNEKVAEWRAQAALGWTSRIDVQGGKVRYRLTDAGGAPVELESVTVTFKRPVSGAEDTTIALERAANGEFAAAAAIRDGAWIIETDAVVATGRPYRNARRVIIRDGVLK